MGGNIVMLAIAVMGAIATSVVVQRLFSPAQESASSLSRLTSDKIADTAGFKTLDPSRSLLQRLDWILAVKMGLGRKLEEVHLFLGSPPSPAPLQILHYKELAAFLLTGFVFFLTLSPLALIFAPLGFFLPDVLYSSRVQKRQDDILRNFPTLVDLAALTIESGLDYMSAFDRILKTAYRKTEIEREVEKTLNEVQLGYSRQEALRRLARRTGVQEVRSFVGLIIQSDELGTSLVNLLRNFSSDLRFRRLNRAERLAAQASTKMLLPLFIFIFPTVFILMLAPMVMELFKGGLPF